ncbi:response regulator [Arenibacter sp. 6A1]|uniref:response regulator n=1 Tax=Arenibacter sp. 6A1 TaxID=2720391 RepID=UPI0014450CF6|nr:response regulator [Arenibacter sp. 6A1]NKI25338.1 response regulator [Arenibacter sp. 6A1]
MEITKTACIIDDDPIFVFGTKILLKNNGFGTDIKVCNNGQEALDLFSDILSSVEELPELILLDLNMPVMDGWEFLEEFNKISNQEKSCIYVLSSSIDKRDMERAMSYPSVRNFIAKPLSSVKLRELILELESPDHQ